MASLTPRPLLFALTFPLLFVGCGDDSGATASASASSGITGASASASATASASASDSGSSTGSGSVSATGSSTTDDSGTASATGDSSTTSAIKLDIGFEETTTGEEPVGCTKVDILFVIDDSGSMSDQQDKLTEAFPSFMQTIDEQLVQKKGVDYRVGVISTDMAGKDMCVFIACGQGHRGRLQHTADRLNCQADEPPGKWIEPGPVDVVSKQFACIASMDGGEFDEMPLEALRAGVLDRVQDPEMYNAGFLREDALLVIMIITDEDDQSRMMVPETWDPLGIYIPTPVIEYQQLLVDLKGGEKDRFVAVAITGPKSSSCGPADDPLAVKAPRLHQFLDLNAPNSYWGNICDEDFTTPLAEALEVIKASCETFPPV